MFTPFKKFKMDNLHGFPGGGEGTNVCMQVDYDGSKYYGYIYGSLGSSDPDQTNDGQIFYSFIWDADGNFVMQFGLTGDEQLNSTTSILVYSPKFNKGRISQWSIGSNQYEFTDLQLATNLITAFNDGETKLCLYLSIEDGLVVDYTYDTILTGTL